MGPTTHNRFLGPLPPPSSAVGNGYELTEDDVLWTNDDVLWTNDDFSDPYPTSSPPSATETPPRINPLDRRSSLPANSGILAALPDPNRLPLLYRRPSLPSSSSKSIPRPIGDHDLGVPPAIRKAVNQSAPVRVPVLSAAAARERRTRYKEIEEEDAAGDGDGGGDEEMLPPHEIVARGSMMRSPRTTFSVLEGVGRTLKGRDLRQVRNAVWRQTGFLD